MGGGTVLQLSKVHDLPVGSALTGIRRRVFVLGAELSGGDGDLELSFEGGRTFSFGVAGDGESLAIQPNPLLEQFPEPLSPDNQEFLRTSGKWETVGAVGVLLRLRPGRVNLG